MTLSDVWIRYARKKEPYSHYLSVNAYCLKLINLKLIKNCFKYYSLIDIVHIHINGNILAFERCNSAEFTQNHTSAFH